MSSIERNGVLRYRSMMQEVLVKRALGYLTLDDEAELAELLDDIWRTLSAEQQQEIEDWLEQALAPPADEAWHELPIEVESQDIFRAPRSAA